MKTTASIITSFALLCLMCGCFESTSDSKLPPLPIETSYRASTVGEGLVLTIKNTSDKAMRLTINCAKAGEDYSVYYEKIIPPGETQEFGGFSFGKNFKFASGDRYRIESNGYKPLVERMP